MNRYEFLAWPAYAVAFVLVLVPLFDVTMSLWPLNPGNEQWRFGAIGLYSNAFMIPASGLLIARVASFTAGAKLIFAAITLAGLAVAGLRTRAQSARNQ